ncbi:MAG: acyl carrier protein [Candidatus Acidiferrales bacterium]
MAGENRRLGFLIALVKFDFWRGLGYGFKDADRDVCALTCDFAVKSGLTKIDCAMGVFSMSDAVAEKVIATLASVKRIPAEKIALDTNLQELGIDSLDVFTLLFELENTFKISIPDDDVRSIRSVNDVVDGIKKILAAAPPENSSSTSPAD